MRRRLEDRDEEIVRSVIGLLETEGYDSVQVRRVAEEASISLATLYELYGSRDELIIRAIERWMADNAYAGLDDLPPDGTPYEVVTSILRTVFARWQRQPHMLAAFTRARLLPGGQRLDTQGFDAVFPKAHAVLDSLDPELLADVTVIVQHVNLAALQRFAAGEIAVDEIVPLYELTLRRLLPDDPAVKAAATKRTQPARRRPRTS